VCSSDLRGIEAGQLHVPPAIFADPSSPIAVWRATATLVDPAAILCARTSTAEFRVFPSFSSAATLLRTPAEGSALLRIPPLPPDYCYADCDSSGELDIFDFLCFQNAFAAGRSLADCNLDCFVDFFDFLCFQNAFAAGC
ncbi:MAG: GC-type dockerin domain-anchored protein, partial [Phycisphaerales bacterium JB039]